MVWRPRTASARTSSAERHHHQNSRESMYGRGARERQLQQVCIRTDAALGREQSNKYGCTYVRLSPYLPLCLSLAPAFVRYGLWSWLRAPRWVQDVLVLPNSIECACVLIVWFRVFLSNLIVFL